MTSFTTATEPKSDLQIIIKNHYLGCVSGALSSSGKFNKIIIWRNY